MRRLALLIAGFGVAALIAAPVASASFHETRVTEVLTSSGGSATQQFVELQDPAEPYPSTSGPYWLVIYDAAGTEVGSQTLSNTALATDAAKGPILISTSAYDSATGTTGDFALSETLPAAAGQACFSHDAGKDPVQCMTWGTITTQVPGALSPATSGAAPGNGQSLQTQCDGTAAVTTPTPGAANRQVVPACTDHPPTASFTYAPSSPVAGATVTFDGSASSDPDSGDHVASWQWAFDGTAVSTTTPTVTRTFTAGAHTVTLSVVDTFGQTSATVTQTVTAVSGDSTPPPPGGGTPAPPAPGPAPAGPSPTPGGTGAPRFAGVSIHVTSVRAASSGAATFGVACPAGATGTCTGKLTLEDGTKTVASKAFTAAAGKTAKVKLTLSRSELRKLRRKHKLKLNLSIAAHDHAGTAAEPKTVKVTVSAPAAR